MIFSVLGHELKTFDKWNTEHIKTCKLYHNDGAIGGRLTFSFTPTGLGEIVKVKCGCGEEIDITDYDW